MKSFDLYEFNAVLTPGVIVLYATAQIFPAAAPFVTAKDFTVGDLGLFVVLAFVAGHLMQALGYALEKPFWKCFGGMPTGWLVAEKQTLLAPAQFEQLPARLLEALRLKLDGSLAKLTPQQWQPITRQVHAAVQAAGRSQRVDTFNANYGLFRGIAAAFAVVAIAHLCARGWREWGCETSLAVGVVLALARMHHFGVRYATELFVQFLQIKPEEKPN